MGAPQKIINAIARVVGREAAEALKQRLIRLHPDNIRFRRFLAQLPLDLQKLPAPLEPPDSSDFIICGCPRTGTSLLTAFLYQPPHIITTVEPWDGLRLPPAELFRSLRQEIEETGWLRRGTMDVPTLLREGRVLRIPESEMKAPAQVSPGWQMGVKWPAYWQFIDRLPDTRFIVCLRHPCEVIASFEKQGGGLSRGQEYDVLFNRQMNLELQRRGGSPAQRRIHLFDWIHERLLPLLARDNVCVVRYEEWFERPEELRARLDNFLGVELEWGAAKVKRSGTTRQLAASEVDLIRRECRTARALGYSV